MNSHHYAAATVLTILLSPHPTAAAEGSPAIRSSAACAPTGAASPSNAPIVLAAGSDSRMLFNAGERVAINSGTKYGLQIGQRFFARRPLNIDGEPAGQHTAGWLQIIETHDSTAIAVVEFSCDAVAIGDHLEAFVDPSLPHDVDKTNTAGNLDFSKSARVLYGNDGRQLTGDRDFVLANRGHDKGMTIGTRFAIYHGTHIEANIHQPFAEAVVVSVSANRSLLRITEARDAVQFGDTLVLRTGVAELVENDLAEPPPQATPGFGEGGPLPTPSGDGGRELVHQVAFDDVSFDFDQYTLKPDALAVLDQAIQVLEHNPTLRITVEGYACNIGSAKYNLALGKRRANAVRSYLTRHGVNGNRVVTVSYGESQPKYDNSREDTRRLNRRAALVVNIER